MGLTLEGFGGLTWTTLTPTESGTCHGQHRLTPRIRGTNVDSRG